MTVRLSALALLFAELCACGGSRVEGGSTVRATTVAASPSASARRVATPGVFDLGAAVEAPLSFEVLPMAGAHAALLVSDFADEPIAFARRFDESGQLGPVVAFLREHVYAAFDGPERETTFVTSDGKRVCIATFREGESAPRARGCREVAPALLVPLGDRLALFELEVTRPQTAGSAAAHQHAPQAPPARHAHVPKDASKKKAPHVAPKHPPKAEVVVKLRFASRDGVFDEEARPIGLDFKQPEEGLRLADAHPREGGADLLWFEWAPERHAKGPLGGARLMSGFVKPDGLFDRASKNAVTDGDLEYGFVRDRKGARLVTTPAGSAIVATDRKLGCVAFRAQPKAARLPEDPLVCAVAPELFTRRGPTSAEERAALARIEAFAPRRAFGQSKEDPGLVAWAGDRAVFLHGDGEVRSRSQALGLATASRKDGALHAEPAPFDASRARLAMGAVEPDGEAIAVVGHTVVHVDAVGGIERLAPSGDAPNGLEAREGPLDRRRIARIGRTWWLARGPGIRLYPELANASLPDGADVVDASVLVGGPERGLLIEATGEGALQATLVDAAGARVIDGSPAFVASPVRVGFDAVERGAGGALVAGVSFGDPSRVVAFAIDAHGGVGPAFATPLAVRPGDFAVRLSALASGGAVLTDVAREQVVWLDDDGRSRGAANYPRDVSDAACIDGRPARAFVPSPDVGRFVRVPELARPGVCIVGEPTWTKNGLRWFASERTGLDLKAELGIFSEEQEPGGAENRSTASTDSPVPIASSTPRLIAPPRCPLEMVLVGKSLCVDRFEDVLVDRATFTPLSPDYAPVASLEEAALGEWATGRERTGDVHARAMPLPAPPSLQSRSFDPLAVSRFGARPNGYISGLIAERACEAAKKRLCSLDEFVLACRGEDDTLFPYGDAYVDGLCDVNREEHPAASLHDNASIGHLDPRLDRAAPNGRRLCQSTGETPTCRSRWGSDGAYDLVGNLDEWVDHGAGAFAGGFFSRATKSGCEALVATHPKAYLDYSTGFRCCKDAAPSMTSNEQP